MTVRTGRHPCGHRRPPPRPPLLGEEGDLQLSASELVGLARFPVAKTFVQRKNCGWKGDESVRVMVTQSKALGQ